MLKKFPSVIFFKVRTVQGKDYNIAILFFEKILLRKSYLMLKHTKCSDIDKLFFFNKHTFILHPDAFSRSNSHRTAMIEQISPNETGEIVEKRKQLGTLRRTCICAFRF